MEELTVEEQKKMLEKVLDKLYIEEETQRLETELYPKDRERILDLEKPQNNLGAVIIRVRERVPEDLAFKDRETYTLERSDLDLAHL